MDFVQTTNAAAKRKKENEPHNSLFWETGRLFMGRGPAGWKRGWSPESRRWMEVDGPILVSAAIRRSGQVRRSDSLSPTSGTLRRESDPGGPLPPGTLSCRRGGVPRFADFGSSPPFCLEVCTSSTRRRPPVILPRPRALHCRFKTWRITQP